MTPAGYELVHVVDLKNNHSLFNILSFLGSLIFIVSIGMGLLFFPEGDLHTINLGLLLSIFLGLGLYVILHETIHVVMMKVFSKEKITVGFNWRHAFAGMKQGYFTRTQYAMIALAPSIILGGLLLAAILYFYQDVAAYTFVLFIVSQNFAGSTGDFYVVYVLSQLKENILINDDGLTMSYFQKMESSDK